MKNIAIGQYYPAQSILHSIDPRCKIILALCYIVASFLCHNILGFAVLLASAFLLIFMGRIPFRVVFKGIRPILFIMLFTVVINLFLTTGDTLIFKWGIINIYLEGIYNAVFMVIRIVVLVVGACMFLTYTTTPIALTDAIEQLLSPLKKIKVPVHEFAMMMTIALRFIPTLVDETDKIMSAQKARGADFSSGGLIKRAKALIPILIPLFVSSFRRADELATAMECRCYRGGEGRTRMTVLHIRPRDIISLAVMAAFITLLVFCGFVDFIYSM